MEKPPVIAQLVTKRHNRTLFCFLLAPVAAFVAVAFLFCFAQAKPPKDSEFLQNFHKNRAAFEQLRDMFRADDNVKLRRVAEWGIETWKPIFKGKPTAADFPLERYQQYLRLLHQVGSTVAMRPSYEPANPMIAIWESGWGSGSQRRHIDVSWMDEVPTNQVISLDFCRGPCRYGNGQHSYRHIDESWYLETNMRPL